MPIDIEKIALVESTVYVGRSGERDLKPGFLITKTLISFIKNLLRKNRSLPPAAALPFLICLLEVGLTIKSKISPPQNGEMQVVEDGFTASHALWLEYVTTYSVVEALVFGKGVVENELSKECTLLFQLGLAAWCATANHGNQVVAKLLDGRQEVIYTAVFEKYRPCG